MNKSEDQLIVRLYFGCMAPSMSQQLEDYNLDAETVEHFQKDHEAINRLKVRNMIPQSVSNKAYDKLAKKIVKKIAETP